MCNNNNNIEYSRVHFSKEEMVMVKLKYRSGTVNSKSFVGKVLLRIKWKCQINLCPVIRILAKISN